MTQRLPEQPDRTLSRSSSPDHGSATFPNTQEVTWAV